MIQHILWAISFFSLWLVIIWLQVIYFEEPKLKKAKTLPSVTIAVPAFNEENTISKTIASLAGLDYPKEKLEIIVVNDGSRDRTSEVVKSIIKKFADYDIKLVNKPNTGKASSVNVALKQAKGEIFGVVDADSRVEMDALKAMIHNFEKSEIGAVISRVKVDSPKKLIEKMQRFEYIMSSMIRSLMARIGTLAMTPGVLSIYRTKLVKDLGGFDENKANMTEDLEIAMRLKYHGYKIAMEPASITHTKVPSKLRTLWKQRVRWSRGYIYNHIKYKDMFFSKKYGLFGIFQLPVNLIVIILLVLNIGIISWAFFSDTIEFAVRSATIDGYFLSRIFDLPSLKEVLLGQNLRIVIPLAASTGLGIYLIVLTHRAFKEKLARQILPVVSYFLFVPYFMTINWISSIAQEVFKAKRKW